MKTIITKQDIINTYDERQQEQCRLYYEYKRIKQENPTYGHKKLAKTMNQFAEIKQKSYRDILLMGYSEKGAKKLLQVSEAAWYIIENKEDFTKIYETEIELLYTKI